MAITHGQQRQILTTVQTFKGPTGSTKKAKNINCMKVFNQHVNEADMPGDYDSIEFTYVGIAPNAATDYATSVPAEAGIGSICHHYTLTAGAITGYKQWHKVTETGATTDWKEVSYVV